MLGPLASVVFINDLDDCANLKAVINKFADDAKLGHLVNSETDQDQLQYCLNKLLEWAETWCMEFNTNKCKVMHIGRKNKQYEYTMNGVALTKVQHEKDIGVLINHDLKPSLQCVEASRRASANI